MDLKTYLFKNNISMADFGRKVGLNRHRVSELAFRGVRPQGILASLICWATDGQVSVDELVNPQNYCVDWQGDKCRNDYKRPVLPKVATEKDIQKAAQKGLEMDKLIKKDKVKIDKMMNTLISKDIPRDKKLEKCAKMQKKKGKKK